MGNPLLHLLRGREIGLYLSTLPFIRKISNQSCERERKKPLLLLLQMQQPGFRFPYSR